MTTIIRVHFRFTSENWDTFYDYIDCGTWVEKDTTQKELIADPYCDDIWVESYDDEEGWQG